MAANALRIPFSPRNPNPSSRWRHGSAARLRGPLAGAGGDRRRGAAIGLGLGLRHELSFHGFGARHDRLGSFVGRAAQDGESNHSEFQAQSTSAESEEGNNESEKAWKDVLESFKEHAIKMQSVSQEAYNVYSKKAIEILEETSRSMMIQADKASRDIAEIAKEVGEEGREYIVAATENSPDSVKDVVEVFTSPSDELKDISKIHDFHVGIPYGALLAVGGFASFMITGSTAAIRFGVILGSLLLYLSVSSLRAWKSRKTSSLLLNSQTAIATIIFIREWCLFFQKHSLPSAIMTIISGAVVAFYIYRIVVYRQNKWHSLDHASDDQ